MRIIFLELEVIMLTELSEMLGMNVQAIDGEFGHVTDFYFDDEFWVIRHLVVSTGSFFTRKDVLVSPLAVERMSFDEKKIWVQLTKQQIEDSPNIDLDFPISRQVEVLLHDYFKFPPYWGDGQPWIIGNQDPSAEKLAIEEGSSAPKSLDEIHLKSIKKVKGHHIQSIDDIFGHVEDFVIENSTWIIRYLVIDTVNWLPSDSVLIAPEWVEKVSWEKRKIVVHLTKEKIKSSPKYVKGQLNRNYEVQLCDYYGMKKYWLQETFPPSMTTEQDLRDMI